MVIGISELTICYTNGSRSIAVLMTGRLCAFSDLQICFRASIIGATFNRCLGSRLVWRCTKGLNAYMPYPEDQSSDVVAFASNSQLVKAPLYRMPRKPKLSEYERKRQKATNIKHNVLADS